MKRIRLRAPLLALAATLFLVLTLAPAKSSPAPDSAPSEPRQLPSFDAALMRQDLALWFPGRLAHPRTPRAAGVVSAADLAAALGQQPPRKLELFEDSELAARGEVLRLLPYGSTLSQVCERNHVDSLLVASVVEAESQFEAAAVSPAGAVGLMQLLPSTGRLYGVKDLFDPVANLDAGSRYLGGLLNRFGGDRELALAAYNTGPEVVARYRRVPPFRETRDFVRKVMLSYQTRHDRIVALTLGGVPLRGAAQLAQAALGNPRAFGARRAVGALRASGARVMRGATGRRLARGSAAGRGEHRDLASVLAR